MANAPTQAAEPPNITHRTIWRWHFYAGIFCIPFVVWLAATGSIYLFKPQIEDYLDAPYDSLATTGPRASAASHITAALAAVPNSLFLSYELPRTPQSAVRVIVGAGNGRIRVYVHPHTNAVLRTTEEDRRLMRQIFRLHGELNLGERGSIAVELAASWAVILVLSGLYLWWPRNGAGLAGTIYPRLFQGAHLFWLDLHAVTGLWVSAFALFLLFSGLSRAQNGGAYFNAIRHITQIASSNRDGAAPLTAAYFKPASFLAIDRMIATIAPLRLAHPVLISPPPTGSSPWTAKSDAPNRTLRTVLLLDPVSAAIRKRTDFHQRHWIDRLVGIGIAAHEGQLFGLFNQLLGLFTALGLVVVCTSSAVLWWRRRPPGVLGAPCTRSHAAVPLWILVPVFFLALCLPLLGASMLIVLTAERFLLRRIPAVSNWLGLLPEKPLTAAESGSPRP